MSIGFTTEQPAEILQDEEGMRLVRLNFYHDTYHGTHEDLARLGKGLVTLVSMSDQKKPKKFTIEPDSMTRLAHAWLAFLEDCKAKEEAKLAAFQAEIAETQARAEKLGAEVKRVSGDDDTYAAFSLQWPADHPLERYNRAWTNNMCLYLSDVQNRLDVVEEHVEEAQKGDVFKGVSNAIFDYKKACERAGAVEAYLFRDGSSDYELSFREHHPFYGFWIQDHLLTAGQVEYRLRYVEDVMRQAAEAKM